MRLQIVRFLVFPGLNPWNLESHPLGSIAVAISTITHHHLLQSRTTNVVILR